MKNETYSIMLYHNQTRRYEYLAEMIGKSPPDAIHRFRVWSKWVDIKDTKLFAKHPICR